METWSIQRLNRQILCWFAAAAAAAKSLQSCPTLCDPRDSSPRGPMPLPTPSLGFSRQEHWRGVPLPSPMHESEKWEWSCSVVSNSSWPHGLQPTRLLRPWDFPGKSPGVGCQWYNISILCSCGPLTRLSAKHLAKIWNPIFYCSINESKMSCDFFLIWAVEN